MAAFDTITPIENVNKEMCECRNFKVKENVVFSKTKFLAINQSISLIVNSSEIPFKRKQIDTP